MSDSGEEEGMDMPHMKHNDQGAFFYDGNHAAPHDVRGDGSVLKVSCCVIVVV